MCGWFEKERSQCVSLLEWMLGTIITRPWLIWGVRLLVQHLLSSFPSFHYHQQWSTDPQTISDSMCYKEENKKTKVSFHLSNSAPLWNRFLASSDSIWRFYTLLVCLLCFQSHHLLTGLLYRKNISFRLPVTAASVSPDLLAFWFEQMEDALMLWAILPEWVLNDLYSMPRSPPTHFVSSSSSPLW